MKKIILIGDSIRFGYDKYVKDALEGVAEVYYGNDSARFSEYTLRYLSDWKHDNGWGNDIDLVHWNTGLWDVLEMYGELPISNPQQYGETIGKIERQIKILFPKAKQVFATSTSVIEERYGHDRKRHNHFIEQYNKIAVETLAGTGCVINDLYTLTKNAPMEIRDGDPTHFYTPAGTKLIGDRVLSVICGELGIDAGEVKLENFVPEQYDEKSIGY
ncbi:MAG: SGNH/GDSL hydrolase family protein [Clostridia bacterium]|nr:SGNH/GDSL hydrolase family protein [Clostridia bacterium]